MDTNSIAELVKALVENQQPHPHNNSSYNLLLILGALSPIVIAIVAWLKAKTALTESQAAIVAAAANAEEARVLAVEAAEKAKQTAFLAAEDAKKLAAETAQAVEKIHVAVNSGATAMQKKIDDLQTEVKNTKDELQIAAIQSAVAPTPIAVMPVAPVAAPLTPEQLNQILNAIKTRQISKTSKS